MPFYEANAVRTLHFHAGKIRSMKCMVVPARLGLRESLSADVVENVCQPVARFYKMQCPIRTVMHHGKVSAEIAAGLLALKSRIETAKVKRHQHGASTDFKFVAKQPCDNLWQRKNVS